MSDWKDVASIAFNGLHTVGLLTDGTVVATGRNNYGQCDVSGWKLFNIIETIENEYHEALISAKQRFQDELANLHGIFSGKHRKEIEARLAAIDNKIRNS